MVNETNSMGYQLRDIYIYISVLLTKLKNFDFASNTFYFYTGMQFSIYTCCTITYAHSTYLTSITFCKEKIETLFMRGVKLYSMA